MPITESAKKALRQNERRNKRNVAQKNSLKKVIKDYRKLIAAKKMDEATAMLPKVYKALAKSAKNGVVKRGKADRLKSRLAKKLSTKAA